MSPSTISDKNVRSPLLIVGHAMRPYFRASLSPRMIDDAHLERDIIRYGDGNASPGDLCQTTAQKKTSRNDIWPLDEVAIVIRGRKYRLSICR
jgi:putative transposase